MLTSEPWKCVPSHVPEVTHSSSPLYVARLWCIFFLDYSWDEMIILCFLVLRCVDMYSLCLRTESDSLYWVYLYSCTYLSLSTARHGFIKTSHRPCVFFLLWQSCKSSATFLMMGALLSAGENSVTAEGTYCNRLSRSSGSPITHARLRSPLRSLSISTPNSWERARLQYV